MTTAIKLPDLAPVKGGVSAVALPIPVPYETWRSGVRVWRTTAGGATFLQPGFCTDEEVNDKPFDELEQDDKEFKPVIAGGTALCAPGETELGDTTMAAAREAMAVNAADLMLTQMFDADAGVQSAAQQNPRFTDDMIVAPNAGVGPVEAVDALMETACSDVTADHFFLAHRGKLARYVKDLGLTWDEGAGVYRYGQWAFAFDCLRDEGDLFLAPRPYVGEGPEQVIDHVVQRQNERMVLIERMVILAYHPRASYRTTATFA